ncbi:hypothetical protein NDU88_007286 [Pleurodeles waltl]|uniref:Uncharacterized protein n=1 Tax=Pleurodeles waltl TaxID=8319 RepID=A0AAV7N3V4_PLEWA|nr:hypothetical protein NDU88_007286 [Pleurodeles waltl]
MSPHDSGAVDDHFRSHLALPGESRRVRRTALALVGRFGALSRGNRSGLAASTPQPHQHPHPVRRPSESSGAATADTATFPQVSGPLAGSFPTANGSDNLGKRPPGDPSVDPCGSSPTAGAACEGEWPHLKSSPAPHS